MHKDLELNEPYSTRFDVIDSWRKEVLQETRNRFLHIANPQLQKNGPWKWGENIHYPSHDDISITPSDGVMNFNLGIGKKPNVILIYFGIWLQFGEIRIGFKIPEELFNSAVFNSGSDLESKMSYVFDGSTCPRIAQAGDGRFFDWILRTGFADINLMIKSLDDPILRLVIADRIAGILVHIYLAASSALIDVLGMRSGIAGFNKKEEAVNMIVEIEGDIDAFASWASENNCSIVSSLKTSDSQLTCTIEAPADTMLPVGCPIGDQDGQVFIIKTLTKSVQGLFS